MPLTVPNDSLATSKTGRLYFRCDGAAKVLRRPRCVREAFIGLGHRRGRFGRTTGAQLAATIDAPDARLRAALAGAMLMGIASQRYLLRMPDLEDADTEDILRLITPLLRSPINPRDG